MEKIQRTLLVLQNWLTEIRLDLFVRTQRTLQRCNVFEEDLLLDVPTCVIYKQSHHLFAFYQGHHNPKTHMSFDMNVTGDMM